MNIDAKQKNVHEVMSMTDSEKVSALSALLSHEKNNPCMPCLTTTPEHMAAVKCFFQNNNIDMSKCDGEQALAMLSVATHSHPKLSAM
jgi:hypothetical protein